MSDLEKELLAAVKDLRTRFHCCIIRSGTDEEFADLACKQWDDLVAKAEAIR